MNKSTFLDKTIYWLLIVVAASSTVYLWGLGLYNSFLLDDYIFIGKLNDYGLFGFINDMYMHWQGRYSGFFLSGINYILFKDMSNLLLMTILHLSLGYIVIYVLLSKLIHTYISTFYKLIFSIITVNLITLALPSFNTFYWGCTVWYISINYIFIMLLILIFNKKMSITSYVCIAIFSIILGGMSEVYTPIVLGGILVIWLFYRKLIYKLRNTIINKKVWISISIITLSFLILLIAPGNKVRIADTAGALPSLNLNFFIKTISLYIDFLFFVFAKAFYYIALFLAFMFLGTILRKNNISFGIMESLKKKHFIISLILLFVFLYLCIVPGIFAMGGTELAPLRSYCYIPFVLGGYTAFWGIKTGIRKQPSIASKITISLITSILIIIVLLKIVRDFPIANKYHSDIRLLHKELLVLKERDYRNTVKVKPIKIEKRLSSFSILYNNTIVKVGIKSPKHYHDFVYMRYYLSPDINDWRNQGLKYGFNLNFNIIGWEREFLWYIE